MIILDKRSELSLSDNLLANKRGKPLKPELQAVIEERALSLSAINSDVSGIFTPDFTMNIKDFNGDISTLENIMYDRLYLLQSNNISLKGIVSFGAGLQFIDNTNIPSNIKMSVISKLGKVFLSDISVDNKLDIFNNMIYNDDLLLDVDSIDRDAINLNLKDSYADEIRPALNLILILWFLCIILLKLLHNPEEAEIQRALGVNLNNLLSSSYDKLLIFATSFIEKLHAANNKIALQKDNAMNAIIVGSVNAGSTIGATGLGIKGGEDSYNKQLNEDNIKGTSDELKAMQEANKTQFDNNVNVIVSEYQYYPEFAKDPKGFEQAYNNLSTYGKDLQKNKTNFSNERSKISQELNKIYNDYNQSNLQKQLQPVNEGSNLEASNVDANIHELKTQINITRDKLMDIYNNDANFKSFKVQDFNNLEEIKQFRENIQLDAYKSKPNTPDMVKLAQKLESLVNTHDKIKVKQDALNALNITEAQNVDAIRKKYESNKKDPLSAHLEDIISNVVDIKASDTMKYPSNWDKLTDLTEGPTLHKLSIYKGLVKPLELADLRNGTYSPETLHNLNMAITTGDAKKLGVNERRLLLNCKNMSFDPKTGEMSPCQVKNDLSELNKLNRTRTRLEAIAGAFYKSNIAHLLHDILSQLEATLNKQNEAGLTGTDKEREISDFYKEAAQVFFEATLKALEQLMESEKNTIKKMQDNQSSLRDLLNALYATIRSAGTGNR